MPVLGFRFFDAGNVTTIGSSAFEGCSGLTAVTLPSTLTTIERSAFRSCNLYAITIPQNVTNIEENAFYTCFGTTTIVVDADNTAYDSRHHCNAPPGGSTFQGTIDFTNDLR